MTEPLADQSARDYNAFVYEIPGSAFSDSDSADVLSYTATLADGTALPTWPSFDAASRTFRGIPSASDVGTLQVRVVARDSSGAEASDVFDLFIADASIYGSDGADTFSGTLEGDRLYGSQATTSSTLTRAAICWTAVRATTRCGAASETIHTLSTAAPIR